MIPRVRLAPATVLAALVAVLVVSWTPAQAAPVASAAPAAPAAATAAESDQATFTGSFVGRPVLEGDVGARVRIYQVEVSEVFGPLDIATERVTVRSRAQLETCTDPTSRPGGGGRQSQETQTPSPTDPASPTTPASPIDRQLRLFETTVQGDGYVVATCDDVVLASETVVDQVTRQLGPGRPPGLPTPTPEPLDDVGFLCPETDDTLDVEDASSCPTLEEGQPFDRAAAPGLALVIVGLLGLVVARRLGRSRR